MQHRAQYVKTEVACAHRGCRHLNQSTVFDDVLLERLEPERNGCSGTP